MTKLVMVCGMLALAGAAAAGGGKTGATFVSAADLKWVDVPNKPGVKMAVVEGDPTKGASHFYLKFDKGTDVGAHHHTADHAGTIVAGTLLVTVDGKESKLGPGSFFYINGKKVHDTRCDPTAECIIAIEARGTWDVIAEKPAKK